MSNRSEAQKNRRNLWLDVDGDVDTLNGHFLKRGYRNSYMTTVAQRLKCKPSQIPLEELGRYFQGKIKEVPRPENWREITRRDRRPQKDFASDPVIRFLTMKLSRNPVDCDYY